MLRVLSKARWLLGGNLIFAFAQWLTLTLIARYCSDIELGQYSYALAIIAPVYMLTNLQLRPILVTDYNSDKHYDFNDFFAVRFYSNFIGLIVIMIWGALTRWDAIHIIFIVAITKALEGISDIIYGLYNAKNETQLITRSLVYKSVFSVVLLYGALVFLHSFTTAVITILVVYWIVLMVLDLKAINASTGLLYIRIIEIKKLLVYATPLGFTVMLVALQTNMPRYFIEKYDSIANVGTFTVFYYFIVIGGIFITSLCQYLSPHYTKLWTKSKFKDFFRYLIVSWAIAVFFGIASLVATYYLGDTLLHLVYGNKFDNSLNVLNILIFSGVFVYLSIINGYVMTSIKIIKAQVPMFIILLIVTVISCYALVPHYKLVGAAWVSVITSLAQFLLSLGLLLHKLRQITHG